MAIAKKKSFERIGKSKNGFMLNSTICSKGQQSPSFSGKKLKGHERLSKNKKKMQTTFSIIEWFPYIKLLHKLRDNLSFKLLQYLKYT